MTVEQAWHSVTGKDVERAAIRTACVTTLMLAAASGIGKRWVRPDRGL